MFISPIETDVHAKEKKTKTKRIENFEPKLKETLLLCLLSTMLLEQQLILR